MLSHEISRRFASLEERVNHLELENRYLKEHVTKLEGNFWFKQPTPPQFTPGTIPQPTWPQPPYIWCSTEVTYKDNLQ